MKLEDIYQTNAYDPQVLVRRAGLLGEARKILLRGGDAYLLGGHGMGKSVLLRQLDRELQGPGVRVVLCGSPPGTRTVDAVLADIAEELEEHDAPPPLSRSLFPRYFERHPEIHTVVLLLDEVDKYMEGAGQGPPLGSRLFEVLETIRRRLRGRNLGILGAGGLGILAMMDKVFGSHWVTRAQELLLTPFAYDEIAELAAPFAQAGKGLGEVSIQTLQMLTGGIPFIVTFALGELAQLERPDQANQAEILTRFQKKHRPFMETAQRSLVKLGLFEATPNILAKIQSGGGRVSRRELEALLRTSALSLQDVLTLLQAAGRITVQDTTDAEYIWAEPIPSILNIPTEHVQVDTLSEQLVHDVKLLLGKVHGAASSFFRTNEKKERVLVHEAVFRAYLALGFEGLGWRAEMEPLGGAGPNDIKLWHPRFGPEATACIELKIWDNKEDRQAEIQAQLASYWTATTRAAVAITFTASANKDKAAYQVLCLPGRALSVIENPLGDAQHHLLAHFTASDPSRPGQGYEHFLIRIGKR